MLKDYSKLSKEDLLKLIEKQEEELKSKKYGLVWDAEREPEQVVLDCENNLPVLKRVKGKEIRTNDEEDNILIEGDNYHALTVLNYTHKEKIDVIYIDPPYNTGGNDFIYNDRYVDKEDGFRHSKWLNFMKKRLILSKELLKETGCIFISIDDNEMAQLKLLCDEIFGENNFLANVIRKSKETSNKGKYFSPSTDYVLCYAKNIGFLGEFNDAGAQKKDKYLKLFKYKDKRGLYNIVSLYMPSLDPRPNQRYFIKCPDGSKVITPKINKMFRWIPSTLEKNLKENRVVFIESKTSPLIDEDGKQAKWNVYTKIYLHERQAKGAKPLTFVDIPNSGGSKELIKMGIEFSFSKPKELIKHLISITNKDKNIAVLDFMAGSGTTGQATLELNEEDGGNRKFILCTNNENNICEDVTHPRLDKVIGGYKNPKNEKIEGLGGNLQYFRTSLIKKAKNKDQVRVDLTQKCTEMLCVKENIFNLEKEAEDFKIFSANKKDKFLCVYYNFLEDSFDAFLKELKKLKGKKVIYMFSMDGKVDKGLFAEIDDFEIEEIPQKIIDIYKQLAKMNISVKADLIFSDFEKAKGRIFTDKEKDDGTRILRIVIEKVIQKIAQNNGVSILKNNSKDEKLTILNDKLKSENFFSKVDWEENKTYIAIGNHAAHGEYSEYDLKNAENFYRHIQKLIDRHNI